MLRSVCSCRSWSTLRDPHGTAAWVKFSMLWVVRKAGCIPDLACLHRSVLQYLHWRSFMPAERQLYAQLASQKSHSSIYLFREGTWNALRLYFTCCHPLAVCLPQNQETDYSFFAASWLCIFSRRDPCFELYVFMFMITSWPILHLFLFLCWLWN